jgi:chromosomal replication initiation ATPase DnaA
VAGADPEAWSTLMSCVAGDAPWPVFLHGPAGSGKTCLGLLVLDRVFANRKAMTASEMLQAATDATMGRLVNGAGWSVSARAFWAAWADATFTMLDELGTRQNVTDAAYDSIKRAVDLRYGKPLIVISNLDLDGLARLYDDRMASRLASGTVIALGGADRRLSPTPDLFTPTPPE